MRIRLPHKATLWAILAGVFYVLCFPRYDLPFLAPLFLPCLIFSVHALASRKQALVLGFLLSSMVAWGGFHWIVYVAQNFGEMPMPMAVGLLCLFCLAAAPQMVAFFLVGERVRFHIERLPLYLRPVFWASLYVGLEYLARFLKIFPEHLGNTWITYLPLAQIASIGGVSLLGFLPLWLGASLAYLRKNGFGAWPSVAASCCLLLVAFFWGRLELQRIATEPTENFRVAFVQHNMDDAEKEAQRMNTRALIESIIGRLLEKTRELSEQKPDLILWPETAYPMIFNAASDGRAGAFYSGYANLVKNTVAAGGAPLLFGGYETENSQDFNSGILLGKSGEKIDSYHKQVLLIFGEYFPFADWFPSLKQINPQMGDFGRGPGPIPLNLPWNSLTLKLGVNICYEALLPEYMRGFAKAGTHLFVNLTKDSWFGNTFEPWQHFQLSALRSIEHRIPMVRATNTGLSGLILSTGEVKILSQPFQEAYQVLEVPLAKNLRPTVYTLLGEWFAWLALAGALALSLRARRL